MMNPDLAASIEDWERWLKHERRYSHHTLSAYSLDLAHFLQFIHSHLGKAVSLADLDALQRSDHRAWLASASGTGAEGQLHGASAQRSP
jgi:integrase/recombinase XerC